MFNKSSSSNRILAVPKKNRIHGSKNKMFNEKDWMK